MTETKDADVVVKVKQTLSSLKLSYNIFLRSETEQYFCKHVNKVTT